MSCSQPKAEWSARLGVVRLSSTSPWQQERRIVGMIKSPIEGTTVLVKLDRPVTTFSDFVRPVCLPSSVDPPSNASHCNTLGWARNRTSAIICELIANRTFRELDYKKTSRICLFLILILSSLINQEVRKYL